MFYPSPFSSHQDFFGGLTGGMGGGACLVGGYPLVTSGPDGLVGTMGLGG